MCFSQFSFVLCLTILCCFSDAAAQNPPCVATDVEPVKVCFADPPLTVDHCSKKLLPHFLVSRKRSSKDDEAYYYVTYELTHEAKTEPVFNPFSGQNQKYLLSEDDAPQQMDSLKLP